jgi:hypothetical protein
LTPSVSPQNHVLLCGARARGEAYTPDEMEAINELAAGVGSAHDALQYQARRVDRDDAILEELRRLNAALRLSGGNEGNRFKPEETSQILLLFKKVGSCAF